MRKLLLGRLQMSRGQFLIQPNRFVGPSVLWREGCVIGERLRCFAGATVHGESRIDVHAVLNISAMVDHNCILEYFTQIASGANLITAYLLGWGFSGYSFGRHRKLECRALVYGGIWGRRDSGFA